MNRRRMLVTCTVALSGFAVAATTAPAQQPSLEEQLIGSWMIVSAVTIRPDGTKTDTFGPDPKGLQIFEKGGRTSAIIVGSNLPKFASNNRAAGTADENKAVIQRSVAFFGPYAFNKADQSFTFQVEGSTFPNWEGTAQKRFIAISGDDLTITIQAGSGGGTGESRWKRVSR
jgi:hypothetical protein